MRPHRYDAVWRKPSKPFSWLRIARRRTMPGGPRACPKGWETPWPSGKTRCFDTKLTR